MISPKEKKESIIEDKTLKNRNKVKSTLVRFIFTNNTYSDKPFYAGITKKKDLSQIKKINCFIPPNIYDKIESNDMTNFYNVIRIRSDLPFIQRDDTIISIDLRDGFKEE